MGTMVLLYHLSNLYGNIWWFLSLSGLLKWLEILTSVLEIIPEYHNNQSPNIEAVETAVCFMIPENSSRL